MKSLVEHLLEEEFHVSGWKIQTPPDARTKEAYIATHSRHNLFIKFDVPSENFLALSRVGEIGVGPRLIAAGESDSRTYIIQEFLQGHYPDRTWFQAHLVRLAQFLQIYHSDTKLTDVLSSLHLSYTQHTAAELATIDAQLVQADPKLFGSERVLQGIERLKREANELTPGPLVPTHPDPNYRNALLVHDRLYMIDWDDIALSDPMRDAGLLLWWYVPRGKWSEFFEVFGLHSSHDAVEQRIYWWVAHRSLAVALWLDQHQDETAARNFLRDFMAAVARSDNPSYKPTHP